MPDMPSASCSVFFIAILFGTSSPKMSVKYERISVTTMTETEFIKPFETGLPSFQSQLTIYPAKLSAAKALPRKPARVIAT